MGHFDGPTTAAAVYLKEEDLAMTVKDFEVELRIIPHSCLEHASNFEKSDLSYTAL